MNLAHGNVRKLPAVLIRRTVDEHRSLATAEMTKVLYFRLIVAAESSAERTYSVQCPKSGHPGCSPFDKLLVSFTRIMRMKVWRPYGSIADVSCRSGAD
jgi:hypothetical protein